MELSEFEAPPKAPSLPLNPARVLDRIIRYWYVVVVFIILSLAFAYLFNRYATQIYPVTASIIIREGEENAGARFLYSNTLVSPYRNYFNEFYIMRSYPLLQQVVEELGYDVSYIIEGDIKSVEQYMAHFPVQIHPANGYRLPYGKSFLFKVLSEDEFTFSYPAEEAKQDRFRFNDTIRVNGSRLYFSKTGTVEKWKKDYVVKFNDPYALAKQYAGNLKLTWAEPNSAVVNLSVTGSVLDKEKDFLNKFIETYQRYDVDKKQLIASKSIEFLDRQVNNISDSLRFYEDRIAYHELTRDYTRERSLTKITSLGETLENQELQLRLQDQYFKYLEEYLHDATDYDQVILPSNLGITDPIMAGLVAKLVQIQFEARLLKDQLQSNANPLVQETKDRIAQYKLDIYEAIRSARDIMKVNQRLYNERIKELQTSLTDASEPDKAIGNIRRNYKLLENLYAFLIQKRAEAALSRASTTSDIIIVNPPEGGAAISPKMEQNYAIGLGIGLLLPLLFFVGAELINNRVQSREDIENITRVPIIAGIGHNAEEDSLVVLTKPRSAMAEAFRALRSNLSYFTGNENHQVFLVTSSIPGEGKSFTSLNLASVLALAGKKTIVIGADLRKPKLFEELNLRNDKGLSQYLSRMATLDEIIQPTATENLFLLPGGPMPPNPSELLLKPEMKALILQLRQQFDYVVLDTPPVGLVTDALTLAAVADHILFVVRQNYTPLTMLKALEEHHLRGSFTKSSIVFNDLRRSGLGYGYGYSSYTYYGYGKSATKGYGSYFGRKSKSKGNGYYEE